MTKLQPGPSIAILILTGATLVSSGCDFGDRESGFTLAVDRDLYSAGDSILIVLMNVSGRRVTVHPDLCGSVVNRVGTTETYALEELCNLVGRDLAPGQWIASLKPLPADVEAGRYVLRYGIAKVDAVESAQFSIE